MKKIPVYMRYWGKAKRDGLPGAAYHLLPYHCLDVAAVGFHLLDENKPLCIDLSGFLGIPPESLQRLFAFLLALHDLGKFTSAFQSLFDGEDALISGKPERGYDGKDFRHDMLGRYFWQRFIQEDCIAYPSLSDVQGRDRARVFKVLSVLMECTLGHHGKPIKHVGQVELAYFVEESNFEAAKQFTQEVVDLLIPIIIVEKALDRQWCKKLKQVSWHLAGLAVLADWVGSDREYFEYESKPMELSAYWLHAQKNSKKALENIDLNRKIKTKPFLSIQEHFGFPPTPLQKWAETVSVDDSPQLFILEDVTGSGKTEAALALTHRLMAVGAADGFYFGLPTMATSNAMFKRVSDGYLKMLSLGDGEVPSIVLAHGARDMNDNFRDAVLASGVRDDNYNGDDATATAQCNQWLSDSRKKALLAPVGVGTIDQVLLAVLPRRHQSLRLLGLHRKVLIFDEVHAADEFMFEILESLLALHLHQGGSVILLTATLSQKQRARLCAIWHKAGCVDPVITPSQEAFPLATKVSISPPFLLEQPLDSRKDVSRKVKVHFLCSFDSCVVKVLESVSNGDCVVWIRNTIDDVLQAYEEISKKMEVPENCLLFHSRFILQDRKRIENNVLDVFGKDGCKHVRSGKVLIASQVFQESLDADADIMLSDICPIDDLIQRAGRLHRHTRNINGAYELGIKDFRSFPELWVHAPQWEAEPAGNWLSQDFKGTQNVYRTAGRLWLGMRKLRELGAIKMPEEARALIESVYSNDALEQIPASLAYRESDYVSSERAKKAIANNQLLKWQQYGYCSESATAWSNDDEDISTRYSDIEVVEVLLLKETQSGGLEPWAGGGRHAVQMSIVKLSKNKYAEKLQAIPECLLGAEVELKRKYTSAKYLQCWLVENDDKFSYDKSKGFIER